MMSFFPGHKIELIKRMGIFPEGHIFFISPEEKSGIDLFGERGGQNSLEMTRSSKYSVKTSIMSRVTDGLFIGLIYKAVFTSAIFVLTTDTLPNRVLPATYPVYWNR
ncbi:hypothetical protein TNCV_2111271 [Trichonephila clavipes]|nr:hypothetical protein TNCV_2111271 [Trichonephila clavipes]